jgi:hypothetical protein
VFGWEDVTAPGRISHLAMCLVGRQSGAESSQYGICKDVAIPSPTSTDCGVPPRTWACLRGRMMSPVEKREGGRRRGPGAAVTHASARSSFSPTSVIMSFGLPPCGWARGGTSSRSASSGRRHASSLTGELYARHPPLPCGWPLTQHHAGGLEPLPPHGRGLAPPAAAARSILTPALPCCNAGGSMRA